MNNITVRQQQCVKQLWEYWRIMLKLYDLQSSELCGYAGLIKLPRKFSGEKMKTGQNWKSLAKESRWIGHVFRHDWLLHEITEGRIRGKPEEEGEEFKGRRWWLCWIQRGDGDREGGDIEGMSEPAVQTWLTDWYSPGNCVVRLAARGSSHTRF